jgi:hypothetical protein
MSDIIGVPLNLRSSDLFKLSVFSKLNADYIDVYINFA